jgi:hypothetical protein
MTNVREQKMTIEVLQEMIDDMERDNADMRHEIATREAHEIMAGTLGAELIEIVRQAYSAESDETQAVDRPEAALSAILRSVRRFSAAFGESYDAFVESLIVPSGSLATAMARGALMMPHPEANAATEEARDFLPGATSSAVEWYPVLCDAKPPTYDLVWGPSKSSASIQAEPAPPALVIHLNGEAAGARSHTWPKSVVLDSEVLPKSFEIEIQEDGAYRINFITE